MRLLSAWCGMGSTCAILLSSTAMAIPGKTPFVQTDHTLSQAPEVAIRPSSLEARGAHSYSTVRKFGTKSMRLRKSASTAFTLSATRRMT